MEDRPTRMVAIHQPNFLPWAGFFLKMATCDVFIFHDNVEITKRGPTRRVKIASQHTNDKTQWLTVPLLKHSDFALIKDLEVDWKVDWVSKHLAKIYEEYRLYSYFHPVFDHLEIWYKEAKSFNLLSELNVHFIKMILTYLDIEKEFYFSSGLLVSGKGNEYNYNIVRQMKGTHYICGKGSDNYQDEKIFVDNHIQLIRNDAYNILQNRLPEVSSYVGLSIVDLLMRVEVESIKNAVSSQDNECLRYT